MKSLSACSLFAIAFCMPQILFAQSVERPRPAGWDRIVPGGRFMERFEESKPIGPLTSECWGGDNVKPRDVRNGMEEPDYSYWGGNIVYVDGRYHLFVARWKESEPKGHMFWPNSEIAHCVSPRSDGDFKFVEVLGPGHNPELFRCKDGSFAVYCIDSKSQAHVYRSATVNGPLEIPVSLTASTPSPRPSAADSYGHSVFRSRCDTAAMASRSSWRSAGMCE